MIRLTKPQETSSEPIYAVLDSIREMGPLRPYLKYLYGPVKSYLFRKVMSLIAQHIACEADGENERVRACERGANFLLQEYIGKCGIVRFSRRVLIPETYHLARERYPAWPPSNDAFVYDFLAGASEFHRLILRLLDLEETERAVFFRLACHRHDCMILERYLGSKVWRMFKENISHLPRPLAQAMGRPSVRF
jgi:hypothetical protein